MSTTPREPTSEECETRSPIPLPRGGVGFAIWYPQMGGYVGKAVIEPGQGCFEAWVWHDGEFPFSDSGQHPAHIHHCSPEQFIRFGEAVRSHPLHGPRATPEEAGVAADRTGSAANEGKR